jgi:hypothetical protein
VRVLSLLLIGTLAFAQQKNFIACPIVRDTQTVPCFLAEYEGETYYLGIQQDITNAFHPPQLKHEVLVEGQVAQGPRICGGIPLEPLTISVIKEVNLGCNLLLPAEPGIEAPPAPRGPGPSSKRPSAPPAKPARAGEQQFVILYSFDDDYLEFAGNAIVTEAAAYAKRPGAGTVTITGYQGATILSNGIRITEKEGLSETRAKNIATVLKGLGASVTKIESKTDTQAGPAGRRVVITIQ